MLALTFQVGSDRVAVDVTRVREVVPRVRLTPMSGGPAWLAGQFVYRGRVVPVIDLHRLAGAGECPLHLSSRIILFPNPTGAGDSLVGLLATQVADIREIQANQLPPTAPRPERPGLGPALPDGAGILRVLDPDALLGQVAALSDGLIGSGVSG
jgi:chemotaxis-related protein WspB